MGRGGGYAGAPINTHRLQNNNPETRRLRLSSKNKASTKPHTDLQARGLHRPSLMQAAHTWTGPGP